MEILQTPAIALTTTDSNTLSAFFATMPHCSGNNHKGCPHIMFAVISLIPASQHKNDLQKKAHNDS